MQGTLEVESTLGRGSIFRASIPTHLRQRLEGYLAGLAPTQTTAVNFNLLKTAKIIVADDEPKNIQVVGALLLKHGHEIIAAHSGPEALEKLATFRPDLILMDVMMPGMTGFELFRIIQQNSAKSRQP